MAITKTLAAFMAALTTVTSLPARGYGPHVPATVACTTGTPVTTAGYQVNYVQATPAGYATNAGYQPRSDWASQHVVASYSIGVPSPIETGFAYSQFKCQYSCNSAPRGSSFFIKYVGGYTGALCSCYNDLLKEDAYVASNTTLVGGWNAICGVTHHGK